MVTAHHDPEGDVESEAGALAHWLGREERLEDPVLDLGGMPGPVSPNSTSSSSRSSAVRIVSVPVPFIADMALSIRFVQTWFSSPGKAGIRGSA